MTALILTYHAVERGPSPLCLEPTLFRRHLDQIAASGTYVTSLDRLVAADRDAGNAPTVAITFDDGFASVVDEAVPLLHERGMPATIFAVAGHLGGVNDWPTQPARAPRRRLADAATLAELARAGFEIGSHGTRHAPLAEAGAAAAEREVVESKRRLEDVVGVPVRWYAYPYGSLPDAAGGDLVERTYVGACGSVPRRVGEGADRFALPRVDAHYLRRPRLFRRVLEGRGAYLTARRLGTRARRVVRSDHAG